MTGALIVLCVAAPYIWDGYFNSHHYPIDWQAWWAFCTFGVAVIAALVTWSQYRDHVGASQPRLKIDIASAEELGLSDIYHCDRIIRLVNYGGSAAVDINLSTTDSAGINMTLRYGEETVNLFKQIHIAVLLPLENRIICTYDDPDEWEYTWDYQGDYVFEHEMHPRQVKIQGIYRSRYSKKSTDKSTFCESIDLEEERKLSIDRQLS